MLRDEIHFRVGHHLRLQEEYLATISVTSLHHYGVLNLRWQIDLERILKHAAVCLPRLKARKLVVNIYQSFC